MFAELDSLTTDSSDLPEFDDLSPEQLYGASKLPMLNSIKTVLADGMVDQSYELASLKLPSLVDMNGLCDQLVLRLKSLDLILNLSLSTPVPAARHLVKVHPILPILARASEDYSNSIETLRQVFVAYKAYQMRSWARVQMYWNPVREQARLEPGLDFTSFLAATILSSKLDPGPMWVETAIARLLQCLPKGCFNDPNRHDLLLAFCQRIQTRAESAHAVTCQPQSEEYRELISASKSANSNIMDADADDSRA